MLSGVMRAGRWGGLVVGIALAIAGCGGGGGNGGGGGGATSGPSSPSAPVLTNFQITALTPERANTQVRYRLTATATDPNGDLLGGHVELNDGTRTLTLTIDGGVLQGSTVAVVLVTNPVPAGKYSGTFSVVDAAGNRSNVIAFTVTINPQTPGIPEEPAGSAARSLGDQLLPAR
jgi:hypothetical protein